MATIDILQPLRAKDYWATRWPQKLRIEDGSVAEAFDQLNERCGSDCTGKLFYAVLLVGVFGSPSVPLVSPFAPRMGETTNLADGLRQKCLPAAASSMLRLSECDAAAR